MTETIRITVRGITTETKKKLETAAALGKHSVNGAVLVAIDQYVAEWELSTPEAFGIKRKCIKK